LIRNILIPISPKVEFDRQIEAALSLAYQLEAHVNAVYIRPDPIATAAAIFELAGSTELTADRIDRDSRVVEADAHAIFEAWRASHGLACGAVNQSLRSPFACWSEQVGSVETIIIRCGRLSDVIVLNFPDPSHVATKQAVEAAVFSTGRPTILIPKAVSNNLLRHVIIAWNGSLEATRAIAGAITLLRAAERISVFSVPSDTDDCFSNLNLGAFLTWHGIESHHLTSQPEDKSIGSALLRVAVDSNATMLVMGGYTHGHVGPLQFGSVTSHVLHHAKVPVLMMH